MTRGRFSAEDKIGIIMEGMHREKPVPVLCRRLGLQTTVYYRWLKDFMEAGKERLRVSPGRWNGLCYLVM